MTLYHGLHTEKDNGISVTVKQALLLVFPVEVFAGKCVPVGYPLSQIVHAAADLVRIALVWYWFPQP